MLYNILKNFELIFRMYNFEFLKLKLKDMKGKPKFNTIDELRNHLLENMTIDEIRDHWFISYYDSTYTYPELFAEYPQAAIQEENECQGDY